MTTSYGADSITVLEGLDAVRRRPGMYIGSTSARGLHHMLWEVVDNGVDEAMAGYATRVDVRLLADGGVEVSDNGRGIPVAKHVSGVPTVDVIMTCLHAGGKFDAEDGAYAVSGGLHGVGVSVVNALSVRLEVEIERDGYHWMQEYLRSDPQGLRRGEPSDATRSTVRYWADPEVFETVEYDFDVVSRRLQEMAFLNSGLEITLKDERGAGDHDLRIFCYPGGLTDFVDHLGRNRMRLHPTVVGFLSKGAGCEVEVALQWNTGYSPSLLTFANTIATTEGGVHEEGFRAALTGVVNKYARTFKSLKDKDANLTGDDIREGLMAVVSVKVADPQFEGQTKTKLGNSAVRSYVQKVCHEKLSEWFDANPSEAKLITTKAAASAHARIAARSARELVRRKSAGSIGGGLPDKLADCRSNDAEQSEIFIVEGDSAGGSAKSGRDSMYQAILPIRGKIINVEKSRIDKVLKNAEVQAIITAFGTGILDDFDIAKLRYNKIVLMADADVDGRHISTLLMTLVYRFMRPLVERGHVYLAQPPLYKIKWPKGAVEYAYSDAQRDRLLAAGTVGGRRIVDDGIQRYKGLGEMSASELWETTMNPQTRVLRRLNVGDAALADELFSLLMGEDVDARRVFITANAGYERFLDI